jgi:hypothetical protein
MNESKRNNIKKYETALAIFIMGSKAMKFLQGQVPPV